MRSSVVVPATPSSVETVFADEAAFHVWYTEALPRVHRYLFHRCGRDPTLAEDLTQEAFVSAIRSGGRFAGRSDPIGWVLGIARHCLADHYRRQARREHGLQRLATLDRPWVVMPPDDPDGELAAALAALPAMQRAAMVLRYMDDLPVRDVARLLRRSEKAVESLLSRGRASLRQAYHGSDR